MVAPASLPPVFTRAQAVALGMSDRRLAGLVRRGRIVRVRPGVYADPEPVAPEERALHHTHSARAALTHHPSGFVVSHLSAAAVHELPLPLRPVTEVHLTATDAVQCSRALPGVRIHHADSTPTDVQAVDGMLVTTVARTVADCLRGWGPRVSVPIADAALRSGLMAPEELVHQLDRQRRWRGRPRALAALGLVDGRRESWLESYAAVRFHDWGLELPEPQVVVLDGSGRFVARVDGGWLEDLTVVELDGVAKYAIPRAGRVDPIGTWFDEKRRYDAVGNLGCQRLRFGLSDLLADGWGVPRLITDARRRGASGSFSGRFRLTPSTGLRCVSANRTSGG